MSLNRSRRNALFAASAIVLGILIAGAFLFWPEQAPPPPPSIESLNASVEKGHYLATLGNCATCHTARGGQAFAGGVRVNPPFGVLYSTNISSDKEKGIGNWTFAAFYSAMKRGVRPDGTH